MNNIYKTKWKQKSSAASINASALRLAKLILNADGILLQHKKEFLNYTIWKVTEANGRRNTRFVSKGVWKGNKPIEHEHVIPRKDKDGVNFELPQKAMTEEQMDGIAEKIAMHLGGTFEREPRGKKEVIADFREKAGDKDFSKERTIERKDGTTEKKDWKGPQPKKTSEKDYNKKNREEGKGIPKDKAEEKSESEKNAGNEGGGIDLDDIARVLGAKK